MSDLHDAIMSLDPPESASDFGDRLDERLDAAYKSGFQAARLAAAELVSAQPAAPAEQEISAEEKFCDGHCSWAEHHPDCSLAAPPAQPVAHLWQHGETGRTRIVMPDQIFTADANWLLVGPMYLHPAAAPADAAPSVAPEPPTREKLAEIVRSHLTSTYHCTRVWEAWHVGTMTEDDFEPASESDMAEDIADAILANRTTFAAPSVAPEPVAWQERQEVERGVFGDWYITDSGRSTLRPPEVLSGGIRYQFRPLYAHPPRAPSVAPEPWVDTTVMRKLASVLLPVSEKALTECCDEIDRLRIHPPREASVAPEPVAWEGGEGWESLAWELCADENGEDACNELIWEGGPIPEPWGDRWMKYEGEAKRLIALVHKHAAHPPRAPLTDEHPYTYTSTQATNCAGCGEYKHTPLRIDAMGGYVCLTCIDKKLGTVLGEFGYPAPQAPLTEEQIDAMWQAAYQELRDEPRCSFDWFEAGIRALEHAHGIGGK